MKLLKQGAFLAVLAALAASSASVSAIEGLQISVQCPDVILGWPSAAGENYIVQWRPTLDPSTPWVTLTNSLPADWTTNWTTFVDSNRVQCASGGTNSFSGGGSELPPTPSSAALSASTFWASQPMVLRADGSGSTVPLCIYPPGIDLSPFIIFDPTTGEWTSGAGCVVSQPSLNRLQPNGPQPNDPDPQDGPPPPDPGFYQVVKDGVRIWGLTNLTGGVVLSNTVTVAFEAGNADPNNGTNLLGRLIDSLLVVDGAKFAGQGVLSAPLTFPWHFSMDTAFLENGDHTLQVQVGWYKTNALDGHPYMTRISDPVYITASNAIYYPDWDEDIGEMDIAAYLAKTTCTDADWWIDIYDVRTNFVQRLTGHTTDGTIEAYWNLTDTNGIIRTNVVLDPEFNSVLTVSDPATAALPKKKARRKDFPYQGAWVVAYQDMFKADYSQNDEMLGAIDEFAWLAYSHGGVFIYPPSNNTNFNFQTYPLRFDDPRRPDTNVTHDLELDDFALLSILLTNTLVRNFYYNGHGNETYIGELRAIDLFGMGMRHRYRFVFLDGCETAKGRIDTDFGIHGPGRFALIYYHNNGNRPAAFCGYTEDVYYSIGGPQDHNGIHYDDEIPWEVPGFITNFIFCWQDLHYPLSLAFQQAKSWLPYVPGLRTQPGDNLQIYGYDDLGVDDFNYQFNTW